MLAPLPVDPFLPQIAAHVRARRAVVVVAAPGAGKTTRVPPALASDGPLILLQPRRVAARSLARWIAEERGWTIGEEIGWQVRFERRFGARTRLLVATEGILTARFWKPTKVPRVLPCNLLQSRTDEYLHRIYDEGRNCSEG